MKRNTASLALISLFFLMGGCAASTEQNTNVSSSALGVSSKTDPASSQNSSRSGSAASSSVPSSAASAVSSSADSQATADPAASEQNMDESVEEPVSEQVYSVEDVLTNADSLYGQNIEVIGSLPQALVEDENGNLIMVVIGSDGSRLQIAGDIRIGGCDAALKGVLCNQNGIPVLEVESLQAL